jgi:transposase
VVTPTPRPQVYLTAGQSFGIPYRAPGQPATHHTPDPEERVSVTSQPEQVEDEEHEQRVERIAAIDVAKASGKVRVRVPHPSTPGRRVTTVWDVPATTNAVLDLAQQFATQDIERVVLESTGDYWRPFFSVLEAVGVTVWLVNADHVKQVPGRPKTDKLDAVWLAKLNERGMLRPSFVPPEPIRNLRDYTRLRLDLTVERSRHKQRMEKLLEDALIKVSTVATDIFGVSGRAMIQALIAGQRDPHVLADLARGRLRIKHAALVQALTGRFDDHHGELAHILLDQIDTLTTRIDQLTTRIDALIAALPATEPIAAADNADTAVPALRRLDEITGVGRLNAQVIIAEIGLDMSRFPTAGHLVSWARLSPRTIQSGTTNRSGKAGKGNPYLKGALGEAAAATARTDTFLGDRYRRLARRRGKLKALVAVARSILVIIWHLLADPTTRFHDLGADFYTTHIDTNRKTRNLVRQLQALGHHVTLNPAA